jgi:site-specific DNA-cytosine methylase
VLDVSGWGIPQRRRRLFLVGHRRSPRAGFAALVDTGTARQASQPLKEVRKTGMGGVDGWTGDETPKRMCDRTPTVRASQGGEGIGLIVNGRLRKCTITELERLQGFPDGYTDFENASYSVRRRVIGNAFVVPVLRWIGERISFIDTRLKRIEAN